MTTKEQDVFSRLRTAGIAAVLILDHEDDAEPVANALMEGGITAMELTLRTPAALACLRRIRSAFPSMLAGLGTVLSKDQVDQATDAGADFAVAPGMNPRTVEAALAAGLPFAPGICTPSDIEAALVYERTLLKFFPAEPSGGLKYLESIAAPYQHLGIHYIPLGGVSESNCGTWLRSSLTGAVGGSWLAPRDLIAARDWPAIRERATRATAILHGLRS